MIYTIVSSILSGPKEDLLDCKVIISLSIFLFKAKSSSSFILWIFNFSCKSYKNYSFSLSIWLK